MIKLFGEDDSVIFLFVYYSKLECCGGTGYQDWERNVIFSCSSSSTLLQCSVPSSCCTQSTGIHCGLQARLSQVNVFNDYIHFLKAENTAEVTFAGHDSCRLFNCTVCIFTIGFCFNLSLTSVDVLKLASRRSRRSRLFFLFHLPWSMFPVLCCWHSRYVVGQNFMYSTNKTKPGILYLSQSQWYAHIHIVTYTHTHS